MLGQSKHNLVKTHQFARAPDADEPELERVLRAWRRILERCLDTLAASDCHELKLPGLGQGVSLQLGP